MDALACLKVAENPLAGMPTRLSQGVTDLALDHSLRCRSCQCNGERRAGRCLAGLYHSLGERIAARLIAFRSGLARVRLVERFVVEVQRNEEQRRQEKGEAHQKPGIQRLAVFAEKRQCSQRGSLGYPGEDRNDREWGDWL